MKLSGLEPDRVCLKGRVREPLCIQLRKMAIVWRVALHRPRLRGVLLRCFAFTIMLVERIGIAPIRPSACKANPGS